MLSFFETFFDDTSDAAASMHHKKGCPTLTISEIHLYTFVHNQLFGKLLDISPKNFVFLKTFDSEFSYIEAWFTNQNFNPLTIQN